MKKAIFKLLKLANKLDSMGFSALADKLDEEVDGVIDELSQESEELLKEYNKDAVEAEDPYIELLKRHGMEPMKGGVTQNPFIGEGAEGKVYKAVLNGKEVAAKVTNVEEVGTWKKILQAKDALPQEAQKHLPVIYLAEEDPESGAGVVAMELLRPVEKSIITKLFPINNERGGVRDILRDEEVLYKMLRMATEEFENFNDSEAQALSKAMLSFSYLPSDSDKEIISKFTKSFENKLKEVISSAMKSTPKGEEPRLGVMDLFNIVGEIDAYLSEAVGGEFFPTNATDADLDKTHWMNMPETRGFALALNSLYGEGIFWGDVHHKNIMQRPSTGDLVIIDVGLWD